jgi:cyclic pyranopterin phosphate synthase
VVPLDRVAVEFDWLDPSCEIRIEACAEATARTGVEMEALVAVTAAGLALYDMVKAVDRGTRLHDVRLLEKSGGARGDWVAPTGMSEEQVDGGAIPPEE